MQQGEEILEPEEGQDEEQFEDDFVLEPNDPQPDQDVSTRTLDDLGIRYNNIENRRSTQMRILAKQEITAHIEKQFQKLIDDYTGLRKKLLVSSRHLTNLDQNTIVYRAREIDTKMGELEDYYAERKLASEQTKLKKKFDQ